MKYYIKYGQVKREDLIVITKDGFKIYRPTEEMILADGWEEYTFPDPKHRQPSELDLAIDYVKESVNNRRDLTNDEALKYTIFIYPWSNFIGKKIEQGQIVFNKDFIYRALKDIEPVLENQEPSTYTSSLYEVIVKDHEGTKDDPIPYNVNYDTLFAGMQLYQGKYYIQDKLYLCIRDSGIPLIHNLKDLIGHYVNEVV